MKNILMSIKPTYSERIFSGEKRFELRRTRVGVDEGDVVIVYASSPVCAVVGAFVVGGLATGSVGGLWRRHRGDFGVTAAEYKTYFDGASAAYAIRVARRVEVDPVELDDLRGRYRGFRPPQSYMHWRQDPEPLLGAVALKQLASASRRVS